MKIQNFDVEMSDNKRTLTLDNNKIHFDRKDPYGLWYIHYDKGQVPATLQGAYTSFDRALADVEVYLANKPKPEKKKAVEAA